MVIGISLMYILKTLPKIVKNINELEKKVNGIVKTESKQKTIDKEVRLKGVGLHTGDDVNTGV